ncbi:MAG: HesA/MoeB/ThiF family protein [Firmicutes bacterium]|nr:HesA/MoeB/ThiF family protein [Bacillota bacterium]MBR5488580.1 HesA/MoeB/ThiF family protein [Bacillota bacterium]
MIRGRYDRNRIFSVEQQDELAEKRVAVIGCGGLGGYLVEMLGRLGVGHIVAVDGDVFTESNLNRQLLCNENNLGSHKAIEAGLRMALVNEEVDVTSVCEYLTEENAERILEGCDAVLDGLDSVGSKLMLQRICRKLEIPMVHGAIGGWFGQVTTVFPGNDTLSLIFEEESEVSQEEGNPSFTPAVVAGIQAAEAAKVLLGYEDVLLRKILFIDLFSGEVQRVEL